MSFLLALIEIFCVFFIIYNRIAVILVDSSDGTCILQAFRELEDRGKLGKSERESNEEVEDRKGKGKCAADREKDKS